MFANFPQESVCFHSLLFLTHFTRLGADRTKAKEKAEEEEEGGRAKLGGNSQKSRDEIPAAADYEDPLLTRP